MAKLKKILSKPKYKGPTPISARKTLRGFAQSSEPLVGEVAPKELIKDERSLYFKEEFENERRGISKWI